MSWPILVVIGGFILISAAQFGGALAARKSVLWWLIYVFLLASAADPKILAPLSRFFGVQVVSNFFFATMVVFLLFQALQENASGTRLGRALRENTCTQAARDYLNAAKHFVSATVSTTARRPRVLVAFPCYNEQEALPKVVQAFHEHRASSPFEIHACFVNDASRDQSEEILEKLAPGEFTNHATNVGVSGVLLTAFKVAKRIDADFVVQCDGDGQHPVGELSRLIEEAQAMLSPRPLVCGTWARSLFA
jgi:predicted LPLAT superfamily acyltransferase